jgi:hypothetical protein
MHYVQIRESLAEFEIIWWKFETNSGKYVKIYAKFYETKVAF